MSFMHTAASPDLAARVAGEIRAELARQRITTAALAVSLGKHRSWLDRRLNGDQSPSLDDLALIAEALGVNVDVFVDRAER